jgi:hypothetical protein
MTATPLKTTLKRLSILVPLAALSACASSPLDFIAPADLALIRSETAAEGAGPISVADLLRQARGESDAEAAEKAKAVSVDDMLAAAREAEPSESAPSDRQVSAPIDNGPISLEQLRAQVMHRDTADGTSVVCQ